MKKNKILFEPIIKNNPITIQVLGICSALAITSKLKTSLVMGAAVIAVLTFANLIISLIREFIPMKIRIICEMSIVATLVVLVDEILKAYAYQLSKELTIFVGLIITNCIVLGRLEGFALKNRPALSILDGLGNGIGYALVLAVVGFFRELLGFGTLLGTRVIPNSLYQVGYVNNTLMVLAPGAFIVLSLLVWIQRSISGYKEDR